MKVLLLQDVKKVGKRYDVKDVNDGYARNFLIPKKLAMPADKQAMSLKASVEAKERELVDQYQKLAAKLKRDILEFKVRTGEKGEVFGSVDSEKIKKTLKEKGYGEVEVNLEKPLRALGEHELQINFGRGVTATVTVKLLSQS